MNEPRVIVAIRQFPEEGFSADVAGHAEPLRAADFSTSCAACAELMTRVPARAPWARAGTIGLAQ
jgi:hypothetical protein